MTQHFTRICLRYGFYFIYLYMCENTLDVLNCDTISSPDGETKTKDVSSLYSWRPGRIPLQEYLTSEPEEVCWKSGEMQHGLVPLSALFVAIYVVGYPLLIACLTLKPSAQDLIIDDQLLKMQHQGGWEEGLTPHLQCVSLCVGVIRAPPLPKNPIAIGRPLPG